MGQPVSLLVIGAGSRGAGYAEFAKHFPERARVVGVAEPREEHRARLVAEHNIPHVFSDWREAAAQPRLADAAIVATQDAMHEEPSLALAKLGYHILLEKPMAPTEDACANIVRGVKDAGVLFGVCHVLRYTAPTRKLKELIGAGTIGDVVSIQRLEGVGYWHQAHSFVRGNWRNRAESSFMLLSKSCHDLDWIRHIMGARCLRVSSFGSLKHFRAAERPIGAADRCLDCSVEADCPYSAKKIYLGFLGRGKTGWPVNVLTTDTTEAGVLAALRNGPYGRCVYECDNDVVDNQVVNMEFEGGRTASFTMTAFAKGGRKTTIFGTHGEMIVDESRILHNDFLTDETREVPVDEGDPSVMGGHGGGDYGVMDAFVRAVATGDASHILSGPDETLETHKMVFAAERARLAGTVEVV